VAEESQKVYAKNAKRARRLMLRLIRGLTNPSVHVEL
jgi:hypothetical protein